MKKDAVYSMRMTRRVLEALKFAAKIECRTVASLLDKIVTDHLARNGLLSGPEFGTERRRFPRKKLTVPAKTYLIRGTNRRKGDIYPNNVWGYGMLNLTGVFENIRGLERSEGILVRIPKEIYKKIK